MAQFLKEIQKKIYKNRKALSKEIKYVVRKEITVRGTFIEIWFMTKGCQWDASGGCVMCNYGKGHNISTDEMIYSINQALKEAGLHINELIITPSGSFLDANEVPIQVRNYIYDKVASSKIERFVFETRAETITNKSIKELCEKIPPENLAVEIGLETSNQWINKYCLNKGNIIENYINAIKILKSNKVQSILNISLGIPFLSEKEAIEDTINSLKWAFSIGADSVVLFPLHVKPGTLLNVLYKKGYYKPVSLWSLVAVLNSIPELYLKNTQISWYRNYYTDKSKIIASPETCHRCQSQILNLLDKYRATCSKKIVNTLNNFECDCKTKWKNELITNNADLPERVFDIYKKISQEYFSQQWWKANETIIKNELLK